MSVATQKIPTPWGQSDFVETLPNGIRRVSTPSHGGYWVPKKLLKHIPANHQNYALKWSGSRQWYEEDCAWACVALAFPELFDSHSLQQAKETVERWVD